MTTKLYALILEDVPEDVELVCKILLDEGFEMKYDVVVNEKDFVSKLKSNNYDIIYADFTLSCFHGQTVLELSHDICPDVPLICISGAIGDDRAVELLKQGATDYVLKDRMERLAYATRRALDASAQLRLFKQSEIELQNSRNLLQSIINNAMDAIYMKDLDGKYLIFNHAAEKALGVKSQEVIGKNDYDILCQSDAERTTQMDRRIIESVVPLDFEDTKTLADGDVRIFHTIKCPMFDDNGKVCGVIGISRDISERKHLERNLSVAKIKAEESDRLKTSFLQNISHEIRTPMTAIVGFASFLKDSNIEPEARNNFIDIISQSCNQLLSIISDIVSIAAVENRQTQINENKIELSSTLLKVYDQFLLLAKKKNITLDLDPLIKQNKCWIKSDNIKLLQILNNLMGNALKFSNHGVINFGYEIKGDFIEFFLKDNGIGIAPEMHEEIFKRFRQVEETATRRFGGSGLGLSISKAYVELLGGKIWVDSELGKGATFYFTIPYNKVESGSVLEDVFNDDFNIDEHIDITILVVEDEELNYILLNEILTNLKMKVLRASNGQEAVDICKTNKDISLVLMDIKMPIMDGYEATTLIKEMSPDLPVIAQTAYSDDVDRAKALACGCCDFICKPYDRDIFILKIMKQLRK